MKHRSFLDNPFGISLMYDTVLFLVMVSLAGVILLPVLRTNNALESSIDKHREQVVDDALHAYLVTRADRFSYRFCGSLIDDIAGRIGIDNTSDGLYGSLTSWLLAHEQLHKTYATLLAEKLGCEFQLPISFLGTNRLNIFTQDYDRALNNETNRFFSDLLGEKYQYNLTAWWHPIKGISFGGGFSVGQHPPTQDCYVARSIVMMPYSPVISIGNHTVIFTKHWVKQQLFSSDIGFGRSSIPALSNITIIFENYTNGHPPYDSKETASRAAHENLSTLVYGFLIHGIVNESNITVFPGFVDMSLSYGFGKIRNITAQCFDSVLNESFGGAIRSIDRLFGALNTTAKDPLSQSILTSLNSTLHDLLNGSFDSLDEAFDAAESMIKEKINTLVKGFIDPLIEAFVNGLLDVIDNIKDFSEMLIDWLFDRVSLDKAEVMLTIWVVRE
ncbi:MAG TPA: hypothetical protein DSN98_04080 [Thermoplasmata archaeon]|jgi:hypothetical protein|nr:MAG TPA: hypothetical protein DSN98_04080 [Thermoplasmata archaeon]